MHFTSFSITVFLLVFSNLAIAQQPFFPILVANKWSYIDLNGKVVLELDTIKYNFPQVFKEKLAAIQDKKTQLFGYIDEKGAWAIKPKFTGADTFNDGLAKVNLPCDTKCLTEGDGLLLFGYTAMIDKTDKIVLDDNAQDPEPYKRFWFDGYNENGLLRVEHGLSVGGIKTLMNRKGEMLGERSGMGNLILSDGVVVYNLHSGNYYANAKGDKMMDLPNSGRIAGYNEGYAWLNDTADAYLLLNKKGKVVLTLPQGETAASEVSEGVFVADKAGETGAYHFLTIAGKPFLAKTFDSADKFSNGFAHVTAKDFNGYINKKGEPVATFTFSCSECAYGYFTKEGYAIISLYDNNASTMMPYALVLRNGTVFLR